MGLEDLNKRAAKSFDRLKVSKGWTDKVISEAKSSGIEIDEKKIEKMLSETPPARLEVENIVHHHQGKISSAEINPLAYIDSLQLPANLSIAIAAILEYKNKGNKKSLVAAQEWIEKELRG